MSIYVKAPGGYVPQEAIAFGTLDGMAVSVDETNPLPVVTIPSNKPVTALSGTSTIGNTAGPFVPELYRPIWLSLTGTWTGLVIVLRSVDSGATRLPLTIAGQNWAQFRAACNEVIGEESDPNATYYLSLPSAGVSYRMGQ